MLDIKLPLNAILSSCIYCIWVLNCCITKINFRFSTNNSPAWAWRIIGFRSHGIHVSFHFNVCTSIWCKSHFGIIWSITCSSCANCTESYKSTRSNLSIAILDNLNIFGIFIIIIINNQNFRHLISTIRRIRHLNKAICCIIGITITCNSYSYWHCRWSNRSGFGLNRTMCKFICANSSITLRGQSDSYCINTCSG